MIVNQKALADVVHDVDLRHHLTAAVESDDPRRALQGLREYLCNSQLAVKTSGESLNSPWPFDDRPAIDEDEGCSPSRNQGQGD